MSGGSNKAANQAQQQQEQQQAQINAATGQINSIFDNPSRTAQYGQLANDTTSYYTNQLNQQKAINDRQMTFQLARNGQTGGSLQADEAQQAGQDYLNGVLQATQKGQQAASSLQAQDQQSRANLIAMAQGGLSATDAAQNAASALRSNVNGAQAGATANALGNVFGDFSDIYQKSQDAAANRQGWQYANASIYKPMYGTGS